MIDLLRRNRRYARLWGGEAVSMLGDQITALALPFVAILLLRAPPWQLGVLIGATWLPYVFALLIGSLVDRLPSKRAALVVTDLVRAAALATVPAAYSLGVLTMAQLVCVAATVGLAGVVSQTAYASFFPRVVAEGDFITASSLNSTARSVTAMGGPPAAGWLVTVASAPIAMVIDCVSYLVSALAVARLDVDEPTPNPRLRLHRDVAEGARTLLTNPWLSSTLWCTTLMNLANFAIVAVIILFATETLGMEAATIGTAQGIGAAGALLGALTAGRIAKRIGLYPVVMIGTVMFSVPFFAFAATPSGVSVPVKAIAYAACGFVVTGAIVTYDITINSVLTKVMPEARCAAGLSAHSPQSTTAFGPRVPCSAGCSRRWREPESRLPRRRRLGFLPCCRCSVPRCGEPALWTMSPLARWLVLTPLATASHPDECQSPTHSYPTWSCVLAAAALSPPLAPVSR